MKCSEIKRILSVVLLCVVLMAFFAACGAGGEDELQGDTGTESESYKAAYEAGYAEGYADGTADRHYSAQSDPEQAGQISADLHDPSGFVMVSEAVPDAILEIRYYSTYNFVGERIDGYEEPVALLTKEAAEALSDVSDYLNQQGYRLKIYDAYRPQTAVEHFEAWALDLDDTEMQAYFYPELNKSVLFEQGYIASRSGHSRGSTVDLTIVDMETGEELDMGGHFDYFGEISHSDYTDGLTEEQVANRYLLRDAMLAYGFKALDTEWWHFTLAEEPYPDTYFDFPVKSY